VPLVVDRFLLSEQFGSNCYVLRAVEDARESVVVDPGGDPAPLLAALDRDGVSVAGILVTHNDIDHVEGLAALAAATGAEVWAPAHEADDLRAGRTRTGREVPAHPVEHTVSDGDEISLAGIELEVVGVPGHSVDHVAFRTDGGLFSGDLLFAGSVGRVDLVGGDWDTLLASVARLLERYGPDAVVFPGHGDPTTLGAELETNPFLDELRANR
jgi:hydroxyacylglutathione hydrolase